MYKVLTKQNHMVVCFVTLPHKEHSVRISMREIDREAAKAFRMGLDFKKGNTEVQIINMGGVVVGRFMYLHDNLIASLVAGAFLMISNGGYTHTNKHGVEVALSTTTMNRLKALLSFQSPRVHLSRDDNKIYLNETLWDGEQIMINEVAPFEKLLGEMDAEGNIIENGGGFLW